MSALIVSSVLPLCAGRRKFTHAKYHTCCTVLFLGGGSRNFRYREGWNDQSHPPGFVSITRSLTSCAPHSFPPLPSALAVLPTLEKKQSVDRITTLPTCNNTCVELTCSGRAAGPGLLAVLRRQARAQQQIPVLHVSSARPFPLPRSACGRRQTRAAGISSSSSPVLPSCLRQHMHEALTYTADREGGHLSYAADLSCVPCGFLVLVVALLP